MDQELFMDLVEVIESKKAFHYDKRSVYEGTHTAPSLGISLPKRLDRAVETYLPWGRVAVDNLLQDVSFDGFKKDNLGFTKLLKLYGGYKAIRSAQKNSMIGSCSFITVLPGRRGEPIFTVYTGAEATGIWDSRKGFVAGLVENNKKLGFTGLTEVEDYLFFERGKVSVIDANGAEIDAYRMPTDELLFIPFIYEQDVAVKPFGESRLNKPFINALDSGLRSQKNIDIASEINLSRGKVLLSEGSLDSGESVMVGDVKANMAELLMIKSVSGTTMKLADLGTADTRDLEKNLEISAINAATAVSMDPTAFGFHPSNGSYSEGTLTALAKPYSRLVEESQEAYGEAIKSLALAAMSLVTGGQFYDDWLEIEPTFSSDFAIDKLGAVGDGLGKILALEGVSESVKSFIDEKVLGLSVQDEVMDIKLPDFEKAQEASREMKLFRNYSIF